MSKIGPGLDERVREGVAPVAREPSNLTSVRIRHVDVSVQRYEMASLAGQLHDIANAVAASAGTARGEVVAEEGVNGAREGG